MPSLPGSSGPTASSGRSVRRSLRRFAEVLLLYGALAALLHFAAPLYSAAVAAALRPVVNVGEGEPPITISVESDGARLLVQSKTYRELRTAEVPTSFQWSQALFLALVFAALPGYPFARRLPPAAIGAIVLFALHVAFAFAVIRVNTVANMGDISRVRFTDGSRAFWPVVLNFLKFAIDWVPIAAWFVPFARSGSLRSLVGSSAN